MINKLSVVAIAALVAFGTSLPAFAGSDDYVHPVNVTVANVLSITAEETTLDFAFTEDFVTGSTSNGITVFYTVRANNITNSALDGAVSAKVSAQIPDIEIVGFPGDYDNQGTASNAVLVKVADDIPVGTASTDMFDKPASSGAEGQILKGRAPIHWRARALADLSAGDGGSTTLTLTLKDV